jgi:hypothetical protein
MVSMSIAIVIVAAEAQIPGWIYKWSFHTIIYFCNTTDVCF